METAERISLLIIKQLKQELEPAELEELTQWINSSGEHKAFYQKHTDSDTLLSGIKEFSGLQARIRNKISVTPPQQVHFIRTAWFRYAAILLLIAGIWWLSHPGRNTPENTQAGVTRPGSLASPNYDLPPGTTKATLTVDDKQITLAANKTGITVGNTITYTDGEQLTDAGKMLTLTTPRGGQYQAILPDGTKVWLNAASGIHFPSQFTGNKREVKITGEAYLEVAPNTRQPFYVTTGKSTIQVLGTSFNVNAYDNEAAEKTTLVEGSIKINNNILKPGEAYTNGKIRSVNIEQATAWKNGLFNFEGAGLKEVMNQLERWYDIEVVYEKGIPDIKFGGEVSRNTKLNDLLKGLEMAEVHFRLEQGRRLVVLP